VSDKKLKELCSKLLEAAHAFYQEHEKVMKNSGAVKWVCFENGELLILTKSDYKDKLMHNIESEFKGDVLFFSQEVESE
jgi:hypothetical protein